MGAERKEQYGGLFVCFCMRFSIVVLLCESFVGLRETQEYGYHEYGVQPFFCVCADIRASDRLIKGSSGTPPALLKRLRRGSQGVPRDLS